MRYDLHIHSSYSKDGSMSPEKIVRVARRRGLDGVAVTDHDTTRGGLEARRLEPGHFEVIVGEEVATDRGDVIGLFLTEEITSRKFPSVLDEIRGQGGIAVIPHPFDLMRRSSMRPTDQEALLVDAIEIFNARCLIPGYNRRAESLARRLQSGASAGSDAHFGSEVGAAGIITDSDDIQGAVSRGEVDVFCSRRSKASQGLIRLKRIMRMALKTSGRKP